MRDDRLNNRLILDYVIHFEYFFLLKINISKLIEKYRSFLIKEINYSQKYNINVTAIYSYKINYVAFSNIIFDMK